MSIFQTGFLAVVGLIGLVVLIIGIAVGLLSLLASIWKWVLFFQYKIYNNQKVTNSLTGFQIARQMLDNLGLNDVQVVRLGFWKSLFIRNSFKPRKNTIRLRKNIFDNSSLTATAIASQKVAIAKRHHDGDKTVAVRANLMSFGYFAPFAIIPLILLGILLDYVIWNNFSWFSIVFTVIAFAYFIVSFVIVILNLKIEKSACEKSVELLKEANLLNEEELKDAQKLYNIYITDYWIEFFYNIVFILWEAIKLSGKILSFKFRKK